MSELNGAGPVFDFSRIKRAWGKRWDRRIGRVTELQAKVLELEPDDEKITAAMAKTAAKALREIEEIGEEQEQMVREVLVSVPDDYLSEDAPDDPDWSQADFDEWLLLGKYEQIITALQEARSPKNLRGHTSTQ